MKEQRVLCFALVALISLIIISMCKIRPVEACYGPHITANISKTEVFINETVTVSGEICPPDYSKLRHGWILEYISNIWSPL